MSTKTRPQGGWQEVGRHRKRIEDRSWREVSRRSKQITKFFVSNLPENCSRTEVAKSFGEFGTVKNVFVARKRDVKGQLFGFVSFEDVYDGLELQRRLSKISMGKNKLKVNIAKYAEENFDRSFVRQKKVAEGGNGPKMVYRKEDKSQSGVDGRTFLETLLNRKCGGPEIAAKKGGKVVKIDDDVAAFKEYYGMAVVGKTVNFEALRKIKLALQEANWDGFDVIYLGGLAVMIKFDEGGKAEGLAGSESWRLWFSELEVWNGKTFPFERIAWLKVIGVPLHLAVKEVYEMIGGKFGRVVHVVDPHLEGGDLAGGCIGVLVEDGSDIKEEVSLRWKDYSFNVWIKEEVGSWIPEGIGRVNRVVPEEDENEDLASDSTGESFFPGNDGRKEEESGKEDEEMDSEESSMHGEGIEDDLGKRNVFNMGGSTPRKDHFFNDGKLGKVTGRRKFRRKKREAQCEGQKEMAQNVCILEEVVRPRKRPRSEDPFGLNAFLGIGSNGEDNSGRNAGPPGSIDLNISVNDGNKEGAVAVEVSGKGGEPIFQSEVEETIIVGVKLGMDLNGREEEIKKAIEDEGIEVVAQ